MKNRPDALISSLLDDLSSDRIEVDMIRFSGPDFAKVDNRLMALHLVTEGLTKAALFGPDGDVLNAADALYKKPILVERGSFRPVTLMTNDLLDCARRMFMAEDQLGDGEPLVLMEITMQNLLRSGELDLLDFLDRVDMLAALGRPVLISNYGEYYRLINYLSRYTDRMIGLPLGLPSLQEIFEEKYYQELEGGILEGLGRLFKTGVKLYVYPFLTPGGSLSSADDYQVAPNLTHLYRHLFENRFIRAMEDFHPEYLGITSAQVLAKIREKDSAWESMVPAEVATIIKERKLFGHS